MAHIWPSEKRAGRSLVGLKSESELNGRRLRLALGWYLLNRSRLSESVPQGKRQGLADRLQSPHTLPLLHQQRLGLGPSGVKLTSQAYLPFTARQATPSGASTPSLLRVPCCGFLMTHRCSVAGRKSERRMSVNNSSADLLVVRKRKDAGFRCATDMSWWGASMLIDPR